LVPGDRSINLARRIVLATASLVGYVQATGDGPDHVSALDLIREAAHRQVAKQSFKIRGGTDRLPKALATRLADRILYGTPVIRIEQRSNEVSVVATHGVHFAGEHASTTPGWMEGALESAERVVREID
jgi:monoamine oxidase